MFLCFCLTISHFWSFWSIFLLVVFWHLFLLLLLILPVVLSRKHTHILYIRPTHTQTRALPSCLHGLFAQYGGLEEESKGGAGMLTSVTDVLSSATETLCCAVSVSFVPFSISKESHYEQKALIDYKCSRRYRLKNVDHMDSTIDFIPLTKPKSLSSCMIIIP